jgi:poly(3-hydroxybutyrate) depolymerase
MKCRQIRNLWVLLFVSALAAAGALAAQAPAQQTQPAQRGQNVLAVLDTLPESPTFARIQKRTYDFKEAGIAMSYEVYVPGKYDKSRPTPLVVALHCLGSDAHHMIRYESLTEQAEMHGFLVVAPEGYNSRGWYGSRGTGHANSGGRGGNPEDPDNIGELSEKDVLHVLDLVRNEFNVDSKRIFLMGHSMGGGGTWYLGTKYPDLWAALAPAAPAIYSSPDALKAVVDLPVIVVQGDKDALVKVDVTRQWVAKMKELNMKYTYVEVPGGDHMTVIARNPENMRKVFDVFAEARRK